MSVYENNDIFLLLPADLQNTMKKQFSERVTVDAFSVPGSGVRKLRWTLSFRFSFVIMPELLGQVHL